MKRTLALQLAFLIFASVSFSSATQVEVSVQDINQSGVTFSCHLSDENETVEGCELDFESITWTENDRAVPVIRRWVAVPSGQKMDVRLTNRSSYLLTDSENYNKIQINSTRLEGMELDPPKAVFAGKPVSFRGMRIAPVSVYPLQFSVEDESVVQNTSLEVNISFVDDPSLASITQPVYDPSGSEAARFLDRLLLNPPRRDPGEPQLNCLARIVILFSDNLLGDPHRLARQKINKFAEWKRRMGYQVDLLAVDVDDRLSDIRQQIRDEYWDVDEGEVRISHLLIIGHPDGSHDDYFFPTKEPQPEEPHGDNYFALMESDNMYNPDISVGRFQIAGYSGNGGVGGLSAVVDRTVLYESLPYMDNIEWYSKGLYTAENVAGGQFVASMVQLGRWIEDRLHRFNDPLFTLVDTLYSTDSTNAGILQATRSALENGRSLVLSRGWLMGAINEDGSNVARTNSMNPFVCAVTCYSGRRQATYFQTGAANQPNGPIATMAMFGLTNTKYNQCILGWIIRAIVYEGLHQPGWIQLMSKLQFLSDFEQDDGGLAERIPQIMNAYRLLGDPSVNVFTGPPLEMFAEYPDTIPTGSTGLNVRLDSNVAPFPTEAAVCIYQPEGDVHYVAAPGDDGWARFTIPSDELITGDLLLTITHPNWYPILDTIEVVEQDVMVDLVEVAIEDEDSLYGSGETLPVTLTFENTGNSALDNAMVILFTEDDWFTLTEDSLDLDDIHANESASVEFDLNIHRASRAGRDVRIDVRVEAENDVWLHAFNLMSSGHLLEIRQVDFGDDQFNRGETSVLIPEIFNMGDLTLPPFSATLVSLDEPVNVLDESVHYPALEADGNVEPDEGTFRVELDETAIPGAYAHFRLDLQSGDGEDAFRDTIYFEQLIGRPDVDDPFGPDEYGYICFDSGDDESWDKTPVYDWIEINPNVENNDRDGTRLPLYDLLMDQDTSAVVRLPFDFRFYGCEFDTLVICTNGWVAFGPDNSKYHLFRNWTIPGIQGPDAQIAVMWQDLRITTPYDERGVFTYYWEERGIFIVEWSNMQIYHDNNADADAHLVEFQLILFDPAFHWTSTGDGEIKTQYKTWDEFGGIYHDNQFCTIGLKNLDNTSGLMYRYWDEYSERCMELANQTALFFSVDVDLTFGSLAGRAVVAGDTSQALGGVRVSSNRFGYLTDTDGGGLFEVDSIGVGRDSIIFELQDYNLMKGAVVIVEEETTQVNIAMTYPLIVVDETPIVGEAQPDSACGGNLIEIGNTGNGNLEYNVSRRYRNGSNTEYGHLGSFVIENGVQRKVTGCQFVGENIYITYTISTNSTGDEYIIVMNRAGETVRHFSQPSYGDWGFFDLAYDGEYLYGGDFRVDDSTSTNVIVKFDLDGERVGEDIELRIPPADEFINPKALAWRPESATFFAANPGSKIYEVDLNGSIVDQFYVSMSDGTPSIVGMAWFPNDNDNMPLYLIEWILQEHNMRLIKVNPENRMYCIVGDLGRNNRDAAKGLTIGYDWEEGKVCLASVADGLPNRYDSLRVYEIGPDSRFLAILDGEVGVVPSEESRFVNIRLSAEGLLHDQYFEMSLLISHNARGPAKVKPIEFNVNEDSDIESGENPLREFSLEQAYPNPFNSVTRIGYMLDEDVAARITIYDIAGREIAVLVDEYMSAGRHEVVFESEKLASGIYLYRLEAGGRKITKRMVLLR